jgi:sialate O-acetylesterase
MLEWKRVPAGKWTKECVRYPIVRYGEQPSLYWETLMSRWAPYTFKGVLWVQGCSNIDDKRYRDKLRALYSGWAKHFENPEMRFYFAEVGFGDGKCFNLQLQQAAYAAENPYAALAPANDVGNARDWHGSDKEMIARRLLLHALRRDYGFKHVRGDAPTVKAARAQGGTAVLEIANARTLYLYNADRSMAADFELAGEDGVWRAAEIVNFTRSAWSMEGFIAAPEIVLKAKGVAAPRRARYLHGQGAKSNVYSDVCLPLLAFETELVH